MSIALDAMGGDHAPGEIVRGALLAAPQMRVPLVLVGDHDAIARAAGGPLPRGLSVRHAGQTVGMEEKPTDAYRKKKDSSLMVAVRMVKEGEAQAVVSAGNTGAANAFCLLSWRQLPGVHKPAIATRMPNAHGGFAMLDAGASPDVDPQDLVEFAKIGRAYARTVLGRGEPRVHLLNIGEEPGKGSAHAKATFDLLSAYPWFAGNIEGKTMFSGPCDVVVCDAFVGNAVLKSCEGIAELIVDTLRSGVPAHPVTRWLYWPVRKVMAPLRTSMDYAEAGGSPLLGLNGLCTICHGRSSAKAIKNALLVTQQAVESGLLEAIRNDVKPQ